MGGFLLVPPGSERAADFLIRLLFCLFSEDIGLLPERLFTRLVALVLPGFST
jgi:hypothetical protein